MPEDIGSVYNTKIPSFDENADVQTAFRLYHYGEDVTQPTTLQPNSVAGHLSNLESTKVDIVPATIPQGADLNSFTTSGYFVDSNTDRSGTLNFPEVNSASYPGVLSVISNTPGLISQQYHISSLNIIFARSYADGSWSTWIRIPNMDEILSETNTVYYKIVGSNTETAYSKQAADSRFAPRLFQEVVRTSPYTLVGSDLSKIVAMDAGVLTIPDDPTNSIFSIGSVINVYNSSATQFLEITAAAGVTLRNPGTIEPYQEASLRKRATNEWVAAGPVY